MVSGVVSDIRGEIAIFDTGRDSDSRPSGKSKQHGLYKILNRVVNNPYDMLGRDRPRFFDQVGHQTTYASIELK